MGHASLGRPLCTKPGNQYGPCKLPLLSTHYPLNTRGKHYGEHGVSAVTTVLLSYECDVKVSYHLDCCLLTN